MAVPLKVGTVMQGHIFRGGNPADQSAWTPDVSSNLSVAERKELSDIHTASGNARRAAQQAREFMGHNATTKTGGVLGLPLVTDLAGAWDSKVSTLDGLSNRMIPNMHVTSGPMTDADAKTYRTTVPNPGRPRETNQSLTDGIEKTDVEQRARAAYYDKWTMVNGSTRGADAGFADFWGKYQAGNPATPQPANPQARQPAPAGDGWGAVVRK